MQSPIAATDYYARKSAEFQPLWRFIPSKGYGIIPSVKKLCALLAVLLPLLCGTSDGKAQGHTFPGLPVAYVAKLAYESRAWSATVDGFEGPVKDVKQGEISVIDAPNSKPRILATGESPVLSPGGNEVAFCRPDENGRFHSQIIKFDGSGLAPFLAAKQDVCPSAWLTFGGKLALTDFSGKSPMIAVADADGGNYRTITEGFDPQWSPDGKHLVYYRDFNAKKNRIAIWVVNVDGTGPRKVIEEDTPPAPSISWNSLGPPEFFDANRIVFSSDRAHNWCVFRVNLDGTGLEKVAENDQFDLFHPTFSLDGKQLVVQGDARPIGTSEKQEKVILLLDLTSNQWTRLATGTSPDVLWATKTELGEVISDRGSTTTSNTSLIAQGRSRYLSYKCDECHGANGEGGGDGPDLIGTRLNADEISKFLEKPSPDAYMKGMPNIPTNHPDNQALVAYVLSLKRPPNPK